MALRWIEGFETFGVLDDTRTVWGDDFYGKYPDAECGNGSPSLVAGYGGEGLGLKLEHTYLNYFRIPFDAQPSWVIGFAIRIPASVQTQGQTILELNDEYGTHLWMKLNHDYGSGHQIQLFQGGTLLGSVGYFAGSAWIYIELKATIHPSAGSYAVQVDGVEVLSDTGVDTSSSGLDWANAVQFGVTASTIDDIYILDGTAGQNDFLGICKVDKGMPTSDYSTAWSRSGGTTNYENLDEVPPSASDYIYSKTTTDLDLFNVASLNHPPLGAQLNVNSKLSEPGGKELVLVCDSNGSQQVEPHQVGEADIGITYALVTEIDPDTSAAWTQTTLNAARWGVKVG